MGLCLNGHPANPFAAYSNGPGLTELLRLYACGLQPRPSVQLSSSRMSLIDHEYSWIPARASYRQLGRNDSKLFLRISATPYRFELYFSL
jgi:hypothetical protein